MRTLRVLAVTGLLISVPARAQNGPASPPGPPANAPGANGPAGSAPAAGAPSPAGRKLTVRVPSGGEYTAYIQENTAAAPKTLTEKADLDLPAAPKLTVYVLDNKAGYAARKQVDGKAPPAELAFDSRDFTLVQKLKVSATGKDDLPIAKGMVTLTDGGKNTLRKILQPAAQGSVEFEFVRTGEGSVVVTADDGNAITKPVNIGLNPGEQVQTVVVPLPQVTATVAAPAGSAPPPSEAASGSDAAAGTPAPSAPPAPAPAADSGGGFLQNVIGWIILAGVLAGGYMFLKNKGVTVDSAIRKLGIQPDTAVAGGGNLAGANLAGPGAAPGAPPPPPPVVSDPNQCPFCGQMKDVGGQCSCSVLPGAGATAAAAGAVPSGSGPRLVGMAGTYMGTVFPLGGLAVIGREATNPVPLDRDTTASRRHAQISDEGGVYRVQDLGSANGTFVNGARVDETVLQPGDEVSIGGTRFRFEV